MKKNIKLRLARNFAELAQLTLGEVMKDDSLSDKEYNNIREAHDSIASARDTIERLTKPQRMVSAEAKETGYGESEDEKIRKGLIEDYKKFNPMDEYLDGVPFSHVVAWLEKQGTKETNKMPIWKHWKDGVAGNGEGKLIYLIKDGNTYRLSSCLGFECDYIELSDLDNLMLENQCGQKPIDKIKLGKKYKCIASPRYSTFMIGEIYKPEDKFLCSLMNLCYNCFEPIEEDEQKLAWTEADDEELEIAINVLKDLGKYRLANWMITLKQRIGG